MERRGAEVGGGARAGADACRILLLADLSGDALRPPLAERVPLFEAIKVISSWVGHYDYNAFDQNAVIGPHPEVANFLFANGFSGHGLQQAPAVGRALAEWVTTGGWRSIDLTRFGWARVLAGKALAETEVV